MERLEEVNNESRNDPKLFEWNVDYGVIHKPCGPGRGEGGFQIVHVSPQGGGGVNGMVHVDFFSGLESLFSNNDFLEKKSASHLSKELWKNFFS